MYACLYLSAFTLSLFKHPASVDTNYGLLGVMVLEWDPRNPSLVVGLTSEHACMSFIELNAKSLMSVSRSRSPTD